MAVPKPTSEHFNDSYDKAGLQPSTGSISSVRNVNIDYKKSAANDPSIRKGGIKNNPKYKAVAANDGPEDEMQTKKSAPVKTAYTNEKYYTPREQRVPPRRRAHQSSRQPRSTKKTSLIKARMRATRANIPILSWGIFSWLFFQLPFALISAISFGLAGFLGIVESEVEGLTYSEHTLVRGIGVIIEAASDVASAAGDILYDLTGIDLSLFHPETIFFITHMIIFAYAIIILMIMYLIYTLSLLKPLGGEGVGSKLGAIILTIIGYNIPILNLFPWFALWAFAVWLKPK